MNVASDEEIERLSVDVNSNSLRLLPSNLIDIIVDFSLFNFIIALNWNFEESNICCMDLSENLLQGEIPQNLYNLSNLVYLDLHHNQLNGSIPSTIENFSNLHFGDLSQNTLSGSIPIALGDLKNLTHFNLSYNLSSGVIPSIESIQKFGPSAFFYNTDLCGDPLEVSCSADGTTFVKRKPKLSASAIVAIVVAAVILSGICLITIININARRRRRRKDEAFIVESTPLASTNSNVIIEKLVLSRKTLPSKYED
ncbi:putative LRR receptor-like serine/threonine-protein kinase [Capsicum chinense]|nr:putative LRR receptor-like serine/threonine-protein kinase [Capsicum chinense]